MITPENNPVCPKIYQGGTGFSALFDVCGDSALAEGVVLCAVFASTTYIFQTQSYVDILVDEQIPVMVGTVTTYLEDRSVTWDDPCDEIECFRVDNCRFPTKEELEWYDKIDTV